MTITERVAYLKGLMNGLELDTNSKEGKVLSAMYEVLEDMANELDHLGDRVDELGDQVDEIDEDLADVEDMVFDDDSCGGCGADDDEDDEDEDDDNADDVDSDFYEVTCGNCGETTYITGEIVSRGEMTCPNCGETIEFDTAELRDECAGCCGCGSDEDDDKE